MRETRIRCGGEIVRRIIVWGSVVVVALLIVILFVLPWLVETEWARERIQTTLASQTNRASQVGSVSFSWTDGLRARDVVVEQRKAVDREEGPLFQISELALDVSWVGLLQQVLRFDTMRAREPRAVLVRYPDGSFNFSDLIAKQTAPKEEAPQKEEELRKEIELDIDQGAITYVDEPLGTRLEMTQLDAAVRYTPEQLAADARFALNEGSGTLKSSSVLQEKQFALFIEAFRIEKAELSTSMAPLGYIFPLFGVAPRRASGTLDLALDDFSVKGLDAAALARTATGEVRFSIRDGTLDSPVLGALFTALERFDAEGLDALLAAETRRALSFDTIKGKLTIEEGKFYTSELRVDGKQIAMRVDGWTGFDGTLNHTIKSHQLDALVGEALPLDVPEEALDVPILLRGNLRQPRVEVDVDAVLKSLGRGPLKEEAEKLEEELRQRMRGLFGRE